jgi:hypothetical protein
MILSRFQTLGGYRLFRGQDRTSKAITTQSTRALAIPTPMTQPRVADSGKGDIPASGSGLPSHHSPYGQARAGWGNARHSWPGHQGLIQRQKPSRSSAARTMGLTRRIWAKLAWIKRCPASRRAYRSATWLWRGFRLFLSWRYVRQKSSRRAMALRISGSSGGSLVGPEGALSSFITEPCPNLAKARPLCRPASRQPFSSGPRRLRVWG